MFKEGFLLGDQEAHAKTLLDSLYLNGVANDTSDTGCGKTFCATAIADVLKRPIFVICPKSIAGKWEKMLSDVSGLLVGVIGYEKAVRGNTKWITYDKPPKIPQGATGKKAKPVPRFLLTRLNLPDNCLVILDEAHRCKSYRSLSAGIMIACKRQGFMFLNLSATLAEDPRDMKAIGYANNLIKTPHQKDYKQFCIDYGATWLGKWGALLFDKDDPSAQQKMLQIHHSLYNIQKSTSRLTREQMAEWFPENHVDANAYTMDDVTTRKIQSVYDWLEDELEKLRDHCDNYGGSVLTAILRARQEVEMLKVPLFSELIEDAYDEGNSVVCFVNFTRTWQAILKRLEQRKDLKDNVALICGGQSVKVRKENISNFIHDVKRVCLANQGAGGVAIDLHDIYGNFPRRTLLSPTYNAREILQALGRCYRLGAKSNVYQTLVYVAGTIEERAVSKAQGKVDNISLLNDGDLDMSLPLYRRA